MQTPSLATVPTTSDTPPTGKATSCKFARYCDPAFVAILRIGPVVDKLLRECRMPRLS
jgi:hypothetical protein